MARIIYGVAGEGFGHSSRSHLIGQHLIEAGNDVMFVASRKAYTYLKRYFGSGVHEIFGLSLAFSDRRLSCVKTVATNLANFRRPYFETRDFLRKSFDTFSPDLVISDFEPFSAWWAWRNEIPFVSIDHEHLLTNCRLKHNLRNWYPRLTSALVTRGHYFGASAYVVLNFFRASVKDDSTILAPPVVRPVVQSYASEREEHILLYSSDRTGRERLLDTLQNAPDYRFYIYGYNESSEVGNCVFKRTSTEGFLEDLASCRGVIATAGFSLISECLHFKKRMLLLPIVGQYEQMVNGRYVEALGLGLSRNRFDADVLGEFLDRVDEPLGSDQRILWPDNGAFFEQLHRVLGRIDTKADVAMPREPILAIE